MSGRHERVLVVLVTAACNLRCTYCFLADKGPRQIDWGPLRTALDWLLASPSGRARIVFTGGEPLLALPLIARAVEHLDHHCPHGLQVEREILTNGLLLGDEAVAFLADHDFSVTLSFDGVAGAQDLRGPGTFATLDRLLTRLRRVRPTLFEERLTIASTVCRDNVPRLGDSVAYLLDAGVSSISMTPALVRDSRWTRHDAAMLDRQFARVYRHSRDHYRRTGDVPVQLFRKDSGDSSGPDRSKSPCRIADGHAMAVDVTGRAVACPLFASSYHADGNALLDAAASAAALGPLARLPSRRRFGAARRRIQATPLFGPRSEKHASRRRCCSCPYLARCTVCPVSIGLIPGNTDPNRIPDFQCDFVRTSLKYRDRFPAQASLQGALDRLERLMESLNRTRTARVS